MNEINHIEESGGDRQRFAKSLLRLPDGSVTHKMTQVTGKNRAAHFAKTGGSWSGQGVPLEGCQMRYIYFLNPAARARLVPKEIPYSEIERRRAGMYRGIARGKQAMAGPPPRHSGAAAATATLQYEPTKGENSIFDLST